MPFGSSMPWRTGQTPPLVGADFEDYGVHAQPGGHDPECADDQRATPYSNGAASWAPMPTATASKRTVLCAYGLT